MGTNKVFTKEKQPHRLRKEKRMVTKKERRRDGSN